MGAKPNFVWFSKHPTASFILAAGAVFGSAALIGGKLGMTIAVAIGLVFLMSRITVFNWFTDVLSALSKAAKSFAASQKVTYK